MSASVGRPFAATKSAPKAKGRAKMVCEKRISSKKPRDGIRSRQILFFGIHGFPKASGPRREGAPSESARRRESVSRERKACAQRRSRASFPNDCRISSGSRQYLAGSNPNPWGSKLIKASPTTIVPPLSLWCSAISPAAPPSIATAVRPGLNTSPSWTPRCLVRNQGFRVIRRERKGERRGSWKSPRPLARGWRS